jgi:ketosteroid isomerase-like protein
VDPEVRVLPRPAEPDARSEYRGLDELMEYLVNWYGQWEEYDVEPVSIEDVGEYVLAVVRERGRLKGSGLEVQENFSHSFVLRDGKVVEWRMFDSHAEALKALGRER